MIHQVDRADCPWPIVSIRWFDAHHPHVDEQSTVLGRGRGTSKARELETRLIKPLGARVVGMTTTVVTQHPRDQWPIRNYHTQTQPHPEPIDPPQTRNGPPPPPGAYSYWIGIVCKIPMVAKWRT